MHPLLTDLIALYYELILKLKTFAYLLLASGGQRLVSGLDYKSITIQRSRKITYSYQHNAGNCRKFAIYRDIASLSDKATGS